MRNLGSFNFPYQNVCTDCSAENNFLLWSGSVPTGRILQPFVKFGHELNTFGGLMRSSRINFCSRRPREFLDKKLISCTPFENKWSITNSKFLVILADTNQRFQDLNFYLLIFSILNFLRAARIRLPNN